MGTAGPGDTAVDPGSQAELSSLPSVPGYEIIEELGRGSMGVVFKARQRDLDRFVALKMILAGQRAQDEALQRFIAEARVVSSLQHPNIVQLYEIRLQQERPFFSMELVEGGTLADRIRGCPLPFRQAAQFLLVVARAMHRAHEHGIVHRDLKPANILLVAPTTKLSHVQRMAQELELHALEPSLGTPKITDFGLAKQLHTDSRQTESGMIMGTPSYMAPEQAEGKSCAVGPAADIYALGAILYEMLTGRPPFTAESPMETVLLLFQTEPIPPAQLQPKVPRNLETICLKCLQKEPQRRYRTADELADDLQRFLIGEPILARPCSLPEKVWKWTRRRPVLATLVGCTALASAIVFGLGVWHQVDLQARLGRALENERAARTAEEEASARQRLGALQGKIRALLRLSEEALVVRDWSTAQLQLTRARDQAGTEPALAELHTRVELLLQQTHRLRHDHERWQQFVRLRHDALFHATLFTGTDRESALAQTCAAAREALALFGITPEPSATLTIDLPSFDAHRKAELRQDCYELLLVLADAVARPVAEQSAVDRAQRLEEALRILDRATQLGVMTHAYHRRRARYLAWAGQRKAADEEQRRAQVLRPTSAIDHFLLGEEEYHENHYRVASRAFENVLQLQSNHFWAGYYLALCELKLQRADQAVARLTACLSWRGDFPWLYLLRASAWGELGQYARAEMDFAAALQAPLSETARYGLLINRGVLRIRQGQLPSAIADLEQAIALNPEQYHAYANLAQAYLKAEQIDDALQHLDEAISRAPELASLYRTRARIHLVRQDPEAALADLDRALHLRQGAKSAVLAEDQVERGRILYRLKEYTRALKAYEIALSIRPEARTYRLRAEALLELQRLPEALQALDDCLRVGPADATALRARAALRIRLGQYPGAQTDFTRALELEPDAATCAARGWCYLVADAPRLALPDFEEALRLAPEQGDAYAGRGFSRILLGDFQQALADAEQAARLGPPSARLYYNVARIYARAGARLDGDPLRSRWSTVACQERAVELLSKALTLQSPAEAGRFWHEVVQTDKTFSPLRRNPGYRQLAARVSQFGAAAPWRDPKPGDAPFGSSTQILMQAEQGQRRDRNQEEALP